MSEILVLYYSRTGNTEKMALAIVEGVKTVPSVGTKLMVDFEVTPEDLANVEAIIFGMPTYHHDMTQSVKNLLIDVAAKKINLKGKIGASFGSYGWSGEAPRLILEILENKFEMNVLKPPLLIKYAPDAEGLDECRNLGKCVAERISPSA